MNDFMKIKSYKLSIENPDSKENNFACKISSKIYDLLKNNIDSVVSMNHPAILPPALPPIVPINSIPNTTAMLSSVNVNINSSPIKVVEETPIEKLYAILMNPKKSRDHEGLESYLKNEIGVHIANDLSDYVEIVDAMQTIRNYLNKGGQMLFDNALNAVRKEKAI